VLVRRILALLLCVASGSAASAQFALKSGDRVAFYGDSITDNGEYTKFVETFVISRYPAWDVRFFNAGVGGDKVTGGLLGKIDERLDRDLFARKPTVATFMLGMNDAGYREFDPQRLEDFGRGYRHILSRTRKAMPDARVWLLKSSPYDDVTRPPTINGGYNSCLLRFGEMVDTVAREYGHFVMDMNFPMSDALYRAYASDSTNAEKIISDRVHPGPAGHLVMAASLLKAWKAEGNPCTLAIDFGSGTHRESNLSVSAVETGAALTWSQKNEHLPFPINWKDPLTSLVATSTPLVQEMFMGDNLTVTGLPAGKYALTIDDLGVVTASAETFARGIDLTKLDTPMTRQAAELHLITQKRAALKWVLWRYVEVGLEAYTSKERADAVTSVGRLEDDLVRRQHALAKPRTHRFKLVAVPE
jgi:lysophospholipase L1-like esterase